MIGYTTASFTSLLACSRPMISSHFTLGFCKYISRLITVASSLISWLKPTNPPKTYYTLKEKNSSLIRMRNCIIPIGLTRRSNELELSDAISLPAPLIASFNIARTSMISFKQDVREHKFSSQHFVTV